MISRLAGAVPLAELERVLEEACGLTLSSGIRRTLGDAFARAASELRLSGDAFLVALRERQAPAVTALVEAAVIGETYFFRHPEQLELIRRMVVATAPPTRPLTVWSAGCATGEEPYSLAMGLLDAGRAGVGDQILATDVSARSLAVARAGTYGEWSLRRIDPVLRARHFESRPPRVVIRPEVRRMVEFRRHNLVKEPPPGAAFDLVVCRNVLIYFTPPTAALVVERLISAIRPGGALMLGPVEGPLAAGMGLERIEVEGATLLRVPEGGARPGTPTVARSHRSPRPERARREPVRASKPHAAGVKPQVLQLVPPPEAAPAPGASPPPVSVSPALEAARAAARRGELDKVETLAREAASRELCPEAWLLVSMAADARGDVDGAIDAVRRALYLDPGLALGHATLVPLFARLGRADDAARSRRNALEALAGLDDAAPLRGLENITAGALRAALEAQQHPERRLGFSTGSDG